jgi:DNA-binding PadR family transcriptional regulator
MTRQSRHLPAFILLTLADGPCHGHAIRAALTSRFPGFNPDPGSIYRALQALETGGALTCHWDTDSRGPARKVYRLTATGWEQLDGWRDDIERRQAFLQAFLEGWRAAQARRPVNP